MKRKRLLSWVLTFAMLLSMTALPTWAEEPSDSTTSNVYGIGSDTAPKRLFFLRSAVSNTTEITPNESGNGSGSMNITLTIAAATVTTAPTAKTLKYNGAAQALVTAGAAANGSMEYALGESGDGAPNDGWAADIPTGTDAETYYVWYRATSAHGSSNAVCVPVTIAADTYGMTITLTIKASAAAPAAPTVTSTATTVTASTVNGCEYVLLPSSTELTSTDWSKSYRETRSGGTLTHTFSELTPGTAYTLYARVSETNELRASEVVSVNVATLPAAPSAGIGLSLIDYVAEQFKSSFTLNGVTYEISTKNGSDFEGSKVSAGVAVNPDGDAAARTYYIRTAAVTSPVAIPASETTAFIIPERPSRPDVKLFTAVNATGDATTDGKILGVNDKMAYATTESGAYTSITANATELTGLGKGSYYLRYQAVADKAFSSKASDAVTIGSNAINLTAVSIVGNAKYGETLTATITPANSTGTITYAWYRGDAQIGTGSTYTLTAADIGSAITVKATQDGKTPVESAATAIVAPADGSRTKPLLSESNIVKTMNTIQVVGFADTENVTYEYSKDGGVTWQDSATFNGLAANTPYRVAVREKEVREDSVVVKMAGVSSDVLPVRTEKDTKTLTGASLNGAAQVGSTLTAVPTPETATSLSYEWKYDGESSVLGTGSTYTLTSKDYGKVVTVTVKQGDSISFSQSTTAVGQAPAVDLSGRTVNTTVSQHSITVTGFTNTPTRHYEYAITTSGDPTGWQNENEFTGLLAGTTYTVYVRTGSTKLDSQWQAIGTSGSKSVTTNSLKDPFNISNVQPAVVMSNYTYGTTPPSPALTLQPESNGAITYYYSAAGFSATDGTNWNTTKPAAAGTYYMRATVAANSDYAGYTTAAAQFTVEKAPAEAPTSVTASGTTVTVSGNGIASGSTVSYAVVTGSNPSAPAASAYKPVTLKNYQFNLDGMAPNTAYTVYVCALGDANHTTSMPVSGSGTTPAQYSVAYNANGGSGRINTQTFTQGSSATVKSVDGDTNDSGFIRPGYTFSGWNTAPNGSGGTAYAAGYSIDTSATLYAQWTQNNYTIKFNPNGGTGSIADLPATYGIDVLLTANTFTKTSGAVTYIFVGWATSANGPVCYADGQYVKNLTTESNATEGKGIVTLYAVWLEPPTTETEITGHVTSAEGGTITLKLKRGDVQIGDTQIKALAETTDGYSCKYTFSRIPDGIYNVVAEQQVTRFKEKGTDTYTEKLTRTAAVTIQSGAVVNDSGGQATTIEMPRGSASSVVNVTGTDTPPVVVGGLDNEAENNMVENRSVSMTISVEKQEKAAENDTGADQETQAAISGIESVSDSDTEQRDFLNIDVQKEVTKDGEVESTQTVTETLNPLELIIPYDMTGKQDYQIMFYRHHDGKAAKLNRHSGNGKPTSSYGNGHFYIDLLNNLIYLWTNQFSTYAIGYDPGATAPATTPTTTPTSTPAYSTGGGSSDSDSYLNTVVKPSNGTVSVNRSTASNGEKVTITVKPDAGYETDTVTVSGSAGRNVSVTKADDTTYTFIQPGMDVKINVTFKPASGADALAAFSDVNASDWYAGAVCWALENSVMNGVGGGRFNPGGETSRAMVVTMLWRLEGNPAYAGASEFADVKNEDWYGQAVRWASAEGIVTGYEQDGGKVFNPNGAVTREQLATMLYRYAQHKGQGFTGLWSFPLDYPDAASVSEWAYEAMCWMTMNGVINGMGGKLAPASGATRAQVATMLMRYCTSAAK